MYFLEVGPELSLIIRVEIGAVAGREWYVEKIEPVTCLIIHIEYWWLASPLWGPSGCFSQMIPLGTSSIALQRRSLGEEQKSSPFRHQSHLPPWPGKMRVAVIPQGWGSLFMSESCVQSGWTWSRCNFIVINWLVGGRQFGTGYCWRWTVE